MNQVQGPNQNHKGAESKSLTDLRKTPGGNQKIIYLPGKKKRRNLLRHKAGSSYCQQEFDEETKEMCDCLCV